MAYITVDDLLISIRQQELDSLTDGDNTLLDRSCLTAEDEVRDYISTRYDVSQEFGKTGNARNLNLVNHMVNIALYKLYMRVTPTQIPLNRALLYDGDLANTKVLAGALKYLSDISKSKINVDLPEKNPEQKNRFFSGGNKQYSSTF